MMYYILIRIVEAERKGLVDIGLDAMIIKFVSTTYIC